MRQSATMKLIHCLLFCFYAASCDNDIQPSGDSDINEGVEEANDDMMDTPAEEEPLPPPDTWVAQLGGLDSGYDILETRSFPMTSSSCTKNRNGCRGMNIIRRVEISITR